MGSTFVALAWMMADFWIGSQLLFDAAITAINVFMYYFCCYHFILFNPVRNMLKKRQDKITSDRENAEADKRQAEHRL